MAADLRLCRDVAGGYSMLKQASTRYLPRHPKEDGSNYSARLNRPVFFNAFGRTVEGLAGMVFRKDPVLGEDVPGPIAEHWEDIDMQGTHGAVFARQVFSDALEAGLSAIFVDYPRAPARNLAEEQKRGLRPYWYMLQAEDILRAETKVVDGRLYLMRCVLRQTTLEPDGDYNQKLVTYYRVFQRGVVREENVARWAVGFEIWKKDERDTLEWGGAGDGQIGRGDDRTGGDWQSGADVDVLLTHGGDLGRVPNWDSSYACRRAELLAFALVGAAPRSCSAGTRVTRPVRTADSDRDLHSSL